MRGRLRRAAGRCQKGPGRPRGEDVHVTTGLGGARGPGGRRRGEARAGWGGALPAGWRQRRAGRAARAWRDGAVSPRAPGSDRGRRSRPGGGPDPRGGGAERAAASPAFTARGEPPPRPRQQPGGGTPCSCPPRGGRRRRAPSLQCAEPAHQGLPPPTPPTHPNPDRTGPEARGSGTRDGGAGSGQRRRRVGSWPWPSFPGGSVTLEAGGAAARNPEITRGTCVPARF